jgi:hypothetical protein
MKGKEDKKGDWRSHDTLKEKKIKQLLFYAVSIHVFTEN